MDTTVDCRQPVAVQKSAPCTPRPPKLHPVSDPRNPGRDPQGNLSSYFMPIGMAFGGLHVTTLVGETDRGPPCRVDP